MAHRKALFGEDILDFDYDVFVREPLYQHSSGRWRNYERHLAPLRKVLRDLGVDPETA
jgi:hypothetical protein